MIDLSQFEVWLVTGSQNLYGAEVLKKVAANSAQVGRALEGAASIPVQVLVKPVVKTPAEATALCLAANESPHCVGLITWCHTFSPSMVSSRSANRCCTCTRSTTASFRGRPSTWTS